MIAIGNTRSNGLVHVPKLKKLLVNSESDREQKELRLALAKLTFDQPANSNEMRKLFSWIATTPTSMIDRSLVRQAFEFLQLQGVKAKDFAPDLKSFVQEHPQHRIFAAFALAHLESGNRLPKDGG